MGISEMNIGVKVEVRAAFFHVFAVFGLLNTKHSQTFVLRPRCYVTMLVTQDLRDEDFVQTNGHKL